MAIAGKGGALKIGVNQVAEVEGWKLDLQGDTIDTTSQDSAGWKTFIQGLKEWSGSADTSWAVATDANGQKAIQDALLNGTTVSVEFNVNGVNKYTGNTLVKKINIDSTVKDKIKLSVDLQGTGALTYA